MFMFSYEFTTAHTRYIKYSRSRVHGDLMPTNGSIPSVLFASVLYRFNNLSAICSSLCYLEDVDSLVALGQKQRYSFASTIGSIE